jgi:cytochrome P450
MRRARFSWCYAMLVSDYREIPGDSGMAFAAHTLSYLADPYGWAFEQERRHGRVFRSNTFFERSVVVLDHDFAEQLLTDKSDLFSSRGGWWNLLGAFFPGGLMLRDFGEHRIHRRVLQVAFRASAMSGYGEAIAPIVKGSVDSLRGERSFVAYDHVKNTLLNTAASVFLGAQLGDESETLNREFVRVMRAAGSGFRVSVPATPYFWGTRARASLFERVLTWARARRAMGTHGHDMLSVLCAASSDEGERLSDEEVAEHILFVLMAAHDTTASALTNLLMLLAMHPHWQERIRDEARALPSDEVAYAQLGELPLTMSCLRETMRLYPPVRSVPRRTTRETKVGGFQLAKGTPVWILPEWAHRDPAFYTEPDRFDPERFERGEHKRHKAAFMPFGAGAHTCLGLAFAELEVKAYCARLLRHYRLTLPSDYQPKMQYIPFVKPKDGPRIGLERLRE